MPLSSFLRFDPWTDKVISMHTAIEPILGAPDKIPFEVAPVYLKLGYYKAPAPVDAAPGTATPSGAAAVSTDNAAPATGTAQTTAPNQ